MLITLFGSVVGTRVHVFFVEFGMLAGAAIAAAIGLAAVSIDPAALSRWPLIGGLYKACRNAVACVAFGSALLLVGEFDGYRRRAELDASASLRDQLEASRAIQAESDRREQIYKGVIGLWNERADVLAREEAARKDKQEKLDNASRSRDHQPCLDAGGLQRLDAIR